jgi:hypothetical protein
MINFSEPSRSKYCRKLILIKIKNLTIWDITPCSLLKINRHLTGTYRLHIYGLRISHASKVLYADLSLGLMSDPEDGGDWFLRNVSWFRLHGCIFQKIKHFITLASENLKLNLIEMGSICYCHIISLFGRKEDSCVVLISREDTQVNWPYELQRWSRMNALGTDSELIWQSVFQAFVA